MRSEVMQGHGHAYAGAAIDIRNRRHIDDAKAIRVTSAVAASGGSNARVSRRSAIMRWLRRAHGWLGLWGALMGLLFGATGIVMNHRAILPVPAKKIERTIAHVALAQAPQSAQALAAMLQSQLGFDGKPPRLKVEPANTVYWNDRPVMQPEMWQIWFEAPQRFVRAEYYAGNRFVKIETFDPNLIATLTRLHQSIGVNALWVLMADSIAGSIMLLALSGLLLWTRLERRRLSGLAAALIAFCLAAGVALQSL